MLRCSSATGITTHEWAALMGRLRKLQEESHMF